MQVGDIRSTAVARSQSTKKSGLVDRPTSGPAWLANYLYRTSRIVLFMYVCAWEVLEVPRVQAGFVARMGGVITRFSSKISAGKLFFSP